MPIADSGCIESNALCQSNYFCWCGLQDAVDCPEWIVPFHVFKALAEEV